MTEDEARKVLEVMKDADGGCSNCVGQLFDEFQEAFPEFISVVNEQWILFKGSRPATPAEVDALVQERTNKAIRAMAEAFKSGKFGETVHVKRDVAPSVTGTPGYHEALLLEELRKRAEG